MAGRSCDDQSAVSHCSRFAAGERDRQRDRREAVRWPARSRGIALRTRMRSSPERSRGNFERHDKTHLAVRAERSFAEDQTHARNSRRDLLEQFQPFADDGIFVRRESGDVAAGTRQTGTSPLPTGSATLANTIGIERVACFSVSPATDPVMITSGARLTSSAACTPDSLGIGTRPAIFEAVVPALGPAELLQTLSQRAETLLDFGIVAARGIRTPMRFSACCACAASGQTAALPTSVMNSRRCIATSGSAGVPRLQSRG